MLVYLCGCPVLVTSAVWVVTSAVWVVTCAVLVSCAVLVTCAIYRHTSMVQMYTIHVRRCIKTSAVKRFGGVDTAWTARGLYVTGKGWICSAAAGQQPSSAAAAANVDERRNSEREQGIEKNMQQKKKQQQSSKSKQQQSNKTITPRSEDFSRWYLDIVREAQLADYGPVRGTMVIRPQGYALWESIQSYLDAKFKETGHQNAYFPQLIPISFLQKEAEHVEGFAPELALVTQGGGKELEEPLVVRPTSETIVNHMFSQWVQSYRDLPLLVNQWANVHRWEMRTRPFIRTLEFLWQEGHTAHATPEEAEDETIKMIQIYESFARDVAAIPVVAGRKSKRESFAGANCTYTIEAMMQDKKALQAGTSHNLGDNFARAFNTRYLDESGELQYVHQSSWGVSTRLVGGIIMTHGDDAGLRLPPKMAPTQVVVIPIIKKNTDVDAVVAAARNVYDSLKADGIRVQLDDSLDRTPGWKFNNYELKGVPVRIEIGPRDVESGTCVVARRDVLGKEGKTMGISMAPDAVTTFVKSTLADVQASLLAQAKAFRDENIIDVSTLEHAREVIEAGQWVRAYWAGTDEEEEAFKELTGATLRCYPFDQPDLPFDKVCFYSGRDATEVAIFAKAY